MNNHIPIVAALDRLRRQIVSSTTVIAVLLIALWFLSAVRGKASVIVSALDTTPPAGLQYWYTVSVPTETGVFESQVFAPALPALFAPQIVELGEPPRLQETPEPGTAAAVFFSLLIVAIFGWINRAIAASEKDSLLYKYRQFTIDVAQNSKDEELRTEARKALEE